MFANFIYLIVALLIYSTCYPPAHSAFDGASTVFLLLLTTVAFTGVTWIQFRRLDRKIRTGFFPNMDNRFSTTLNRYSILAIFLFAFDIYGLNLTLFTSRVALLSAFPTIEALIFMGLYLFYMVIVSGCAWFPYHRLYQNDILLKSYVTSQISFSIPVLLPWFLISGASDILQLLPFEAPKKFLAAPSGQLIFFLVFLILTALTGPAIIQKFWRCRPLESGYIRSRIEALSQRAGFTFANIVYWPIFGGRMITAGVMGLVKSFRYLLVTEALLQFLNPDEIDAVVAHEIGHVKKRHLLFYLFFFAGYMMISYTLYDALLIVILYVPQLYRLMEYFLSQETTASSALFTMGTILSFLIYFRYIFGYFMRNFERQADAYVFTLFNSSIPLITTLEKIALTSGQPADKPNWHHFSIAERIGFLKKCEQDRSWIQRHDRKIRRSITAFLAALLIFGAVGYTLSWSDTGKKLNSTLAERILLRKIEKDPENPAIYNILGDIYVSQNKPKAAIRAYEKALALQPDNFSVLNNLAWLLATSTDPSLRDPQRAASLAGQAAELHPTAQILDTLAESLYACGRYDDAVTIGERALNRAAENRGYFQKQLEKFKREAERHQKAQSPNAT